MRCMPVFLNYYNKNQSIPELFAMGFAAYIAFMKPVKQIGKEFFGEFRGQSYLIEDETAEIFYKMWQTSPVNKVVKEVLGNVGFWGKDLTTITGFEQSVTDKLNRILINGMRAAVEDIYSKKIYV